MRLQSLLREGDLGHHRAVVLQGTENCMTLRPTDDTLDGLWQCVIIGPQMELYGMTSCVAGGVTADGPRR